MPSNKNILELFRVYILYLGVGREEVVDIPDHCEFAVYVGDVFVEEGEVLTGEDGARL